MKITYYGHSTFTIESGSTKILFDPFITPNPAAGNIDVDSIRPTHILVTHGHGDHVADVERIAKTSNAIVVASYEVASWFEAKGLQVAHMNTGGNRVFEGFSVKAVVAQHSSVLPDGTYGGHPLGFVVNIEGKNIYYSGDTALTLDMKLIGEYLQPALSFLCIGDNFTMGYQDAIIAADYVGCNKVIGMHFDTFPVIKVDHDTAIAAFKQAGKELTLMSLGSSLEF